MKWMRAIARSTLALSLALGFVAQSIAIVEHPFQHDAQAIRSHFKADFSKEYRNSSDFGLLDSSECFVCTQLNQSRLAVLKAITFGNAFVARSGFVLTTSVIATQSNSSLFSARAPPSFLRS